MHNSDEYGVLRWDTREIVEALGCKSTQVEELVEKGVMKGCNSGMCDPYIYVPRSGRKDGVPVVILEAQHGPIWFSSRMLRDDHIRKIKELNGSKSQPLKLVK